MIRILGALALAVGVGACNGDATAPDIATTQFGPSLGVDLAASVKTPSGLYYRDIVIGTGAMVENGQRVSVRYTGSFKSGNVFDSNTAAAAPFTFTLGARNVIEGWDEGIPGMRVGGRRQLIIPPALGYGSEDYGRIPGNSILVFTVEIVGVTAS